jgi:uncharacterized membrane protein
LRIGSFGIALGKILGVAVFIQSADDTVNPAKTKFFFNRVVVEDTLFTGVFLIKDQPDLFSLSVILRQPGAPIPAVGYVQ